MGRIGTDRLYVHTRQAAFRRDVGRDFRVARKVRIVEHRLVVPVTHDRSLPDADSLGVSVNRNKVTGVVELFEELETSLGGFLSGRTGCKAGGPYRENCCIGG